MNNKYTELEIKVARMLRLDCIQTYYGVGALTREDGLLLLNDCLDPEDPSTLVDDSDKLDWSEKQVADYFGVAEDDNEVNQ